MGEPNQGVQFSNLFINDAYYLNNGEATQERNEIKVTEAADIYLIKQPLSFEFNIDNLTMYLQNFSQVMNQHAILLNGLKELMKKRVSENDLTNILEDITSTTLIPNSEFNYQLSFKSRKQTQEYSQENELNSAKHKFSQQQQLYGEALSYLYNKIQSIELRQDETENNFEGRIKLLETDIQTKAAQTDLDSFDTKYVNFFNHFDKQTKQALEDVEQKINNQEQSFSRFLQDMEDTKIKDLQSKLLTSEHKLDNYHNDFLSNMKVLQENLNEKINQSNALIEEINLACQEKLDINIYKDTLQDLNEKIDRALERAGSDSNNFTSDQKYENIEKKVNQIENLFEKMKIQVESGQKNDGSKKLQNIDSAHFSDLGNNFDDIKNAILENRDLLLKFEKELVNKVDMQTYVNDLEDKIDKKDINNYIENIGSDTDKIRKIQRDVDELNKRLESFASNLEKRFGKLKRDLDVNNLMRQLKSKAETDDVKNEFSVRDAKMGSVGDTIGALRKELDELGGTFRKYISVLSSQKKQYESALARTQNIPAHICLSCGRGLMDFVTVLPLQNQIRGKDNKLYKIDAGRTQGYADEYCGKHESAIIGESQRLLQDHLRTQQHCYMPYSTPIKPISKNGKYAMAPSTSYQSDKRNKTQTNFRKIENNYQMNSEKDFQTRDSNYIRPSVAGPRFISKM